MTKIKLSIFVIVMALSSGCARVEPWERGYLADDIMSLDEPASDGFHREIVQIREASALGDAGTGGGCGCN